MYPWKITPVDGYKRRENSKQDALKTVQRVVKQIKKKLLVKGQATFI